MRLPRLVVAGILVPGLLVLSACGSSDPPAGTPAPRADPKGRSAPAGVAELEHIHGLGEDPRTGELFVATHYGLFRAPRGQQTLTRAGGSRQDTMGFSVVDSGHFIGSGHPDPAAGGPAALGLIASSDRGRSWRPISLGGQADFHVLRASGRHVYGVDSGTGAVMASGNGGRTWAERKPPAAVFDLAIDPESPRRVVVSTAGGIFGSADGGEHWRRLATDTAGLLAWPASGQLVLVDAQGAVSHSTDAGRSFTPVGGAIGGPPSAFAAAKGGLLAALGDGRVLRSSDGGATWTERARP